MQRAALEALEPRMLLTALTGSDIAGTWDYAALGAAGTIQFDDAGGVIGGSLVHANGSGTTTPSGTYSVTGSGGMTVVTPQSSKTGVVASGRGVAVITDLVPGTSNFSNSLSVLVKSSASGFSDADVSGLWWFFLSGDDSGGSGQGDIVFDGQGNVTGGSVVTTDGTTTFTGGTYTVSSTGAVSVVVDLRSANGTTKSATVNGQVDPAKDTMALSPADLVDAANNDASRLFVALKESSAFSAADLSGAWNFEGDGIGGSLLFDGHGKVTGGGIGSDGDAVSISGTYSVASDGFVSVALHIVSSSGSMSSNFQGWLNASRDLTALEPPPSTSPGHNSTDGLLLLVKPGDNAPTLSSVAAFGVATAGSMYTGITYSSLLGQSNATDSDGDTVSFFVSSLGSGTLSLNGDPVQTGAMISTGDTLTWTPASNTSGAVTAFSVKAFDGSALSAAAIPVTVNTILPPTVGITATRNKASEVNDGVSKGIGEYTITRVHGDLSQPLTVFYDVTGTATNGSDYNTLPGSITIGANVTSATITLVPVPDNARESTEAAILSLTAQQPYLVDPKKDSGTVTIADVEFPPDSLAGLTANITVSSGVGPISTAGSYQLIFSASDNRELRVGAKDQLVMPGNFTYQHLTSTVGIVAFDDPNFGTVQGTLTFSSPTAATFNFGNIAGTQVGKLTLVTPKSTIAPVALSGRSGNLAIKAGQSLPGRGSLQLILSQNSSQFISAGTSPVASSFGTYTYERFAPNVGFLTVDDSANANGFIVLQFMSATSAGYSAQYMTQASERGTFSLNAVPNNTLVPATVNGHSLSGKISAGTGVFAVKGTFTQTFLPTTYAISGTMTSTGTYSYETMTPTIGLLTLTDSTGGPEHEVVTFTTSSKASVLLLNDSAGGFLRATVAFI